MSDATTEIFGGWVTIAIGSGVLLYATIGRLAGFHRPLKIVGGGETSFVGEIYFGMFFICLGFAMLSNSPIWTLLAVTAFGVFLLSHWHEKRQYAARVAELRAKNSANCPGVFDNPPPSEFAATDARVFNLYDERLGTYLGRASRDDLGVLIGQWGDPAHGDNDLYLLHECLGAFPNGTLSSEFTELLEHAFEGEADGEIVLRWVPVSDDEG